MEFLMNKLEYGWFQMDLKDIIIDALKYPFSDVKMILLLGFVLLLADLVNEIHVTDKLSVIIKLTLTLIALVMFVLESGYLFKVIEETARGSHSLPKFNELKSICIHGVKEIIVTLLYLSLPLFGVIISVYFFLSSKYTHNLGELNLGYVFLIVGLMSTLILSFIMQGVILNMAHNRGSIRSAFDFGIIKEKMGKIGYKNLLLTYIIAFATFGSLIVFFSNTIKSIPFIGILILMLFIEPYLLLFNLRLLGLVDKT